MLVGRDVVSRLDVASGADESVELVAAPPLRRHVLPKDLPASIKQLDDPELDRLLAAALAEQKRRGGKSIVSAETLDKRLAHAPLRLSAKARSIRHWARSRCRQLEAGPPIVERRHSLACESTWTRSRSLMIGIGPCLRCCSSRVAACPPFIFTASSPPAA